MHCFGRADAEKDPQDDRMGDFLRQRRVETRPSLLDRAEMKCRRVGDGLDVGGIRRVGVSAGDCRKLPCGQARNRLGESECRIQIRIMIGVAVPRPIACIDCELHEVREPFFCFVGSRRLTARQGTKSIEINWVSADRNQESVDEALVTEFVVCIVMMY